MTLEQFAKVQRQMAEESSLDAFLPTLWVLRSGKVDVNVLTDPPSLGHLRTAVERWAKTVAGGCDCFYAFRYDTKAMACVSDVAGKRQERLVVIGE